MRPCYCHGSIIALCFLYDAFLMKASVHGGGLHSGGYSRKTVRRSQSNGRGRCWWKQGWGATITGAVCALKKIVNHRRRGCVKAEMRIGLITGLSEALFTSLIPIRLQGTFIKQEHAMLCLGLPDPCTLVSLIWLNNRSPTDSLCGCGKRGITGDLKTSLISNSTQSLSV